MRRQILILMGFFLAFTILGGCSGGGSAPVLPDFPEGTALQVPEAIEGDTQEDSGIPFGGMLGGDSGPELTDVVDEGAGHYLLFLYHLNFDPESGQVEVAQSRSAGFHVNVTEKVKPPECDDCVTVKVMQIDHENHIYKLKVSLRNPTDIKVYDVRGILFIGGPADKRELVNADNYTTIWDPNNPKLKNPYKAFMTEDPKRAFGSGLTNSVIYDVKFPPPPNFMVDFAIDISWPGNMKDPYDITNQLADNYLYTTPGKYANIMCKVHDWQDDTEFVKLDISELAGSDIELDMLYEPISKLYSTPISNEYGASEGIYDLEIIAKSEGNAKRLYDYLAVEVTTYINEPPGWFGGIVGIDGAIPLDEAVEISYGIGIDVDLPVTYTIYCSTTSPIDFESILHPPKDIDGTPYLYEGLTNDVTYYFAVRAKDGLGAEDDNTNERSATPHEINYPPHWVGEPGVLEVMPHMPFQVSVYYGEAIDEHEPVTYTVYYDLPFGFDWGTANKSEDNPGSPTIITLPENDVGYLFGVRARDALGMEDSNENVRLGAAINLPPMWDELPGGIREANPGDGSVEVVFGTATDPDSMGGDVVYNVYWSLNELNSETNFDNANHETTAGSPFVVEPLPNGWQFYFAVRAMDEFGLEETNMFYLAATPQNQPPVWDGPAGVQNLIPGNEKVTVEYGTASDPDIPVTYNVYYALSDFNFWHDAEVKPGNPGSPTVIDGLINDIPWFFAVRAEDNEGLEDDNEVIMSAIPFYNNEPPVWDTTVGVQDVIGTDLQVTVIYGTASDPDEPVIYVVYYSETTPIDFDHAFMVPDMDGSPTVISPLPNGDTFYFAVRARDALGMEDDNTVELAGAAVNQPPVWDTTIGIVDVQAKDEYALVYFGTASDPSEPVRYNVYWDDESPISFGSCWSSKGNPGSPVFVSPLVNGKTYWFAVRAEDAEGLEDDNTVELSATPEEQPPVWDDTIGIQEAIPGNQQVTVIYGTASDPDMPVTYNIYVSTTSPIDFSGPPTLEAQPGSPTVVTPLVNEQQYYFGVRARDATGMEDSNTVEIAETPFYDNQPPVWDGFPPGIQDAIPGDQQVTVIYGTASDPDLPVTYNVYWDDESPLYFPDAGKKIGEPGSPTIVDGLENDKTYYFVVRAMDGLGLEDDNINELPAMPSSGNTPPVWDGPEGIQDAIPLSQAFEVLYGTATDPDLPVTYRVYYEMGTPVNWDTSDYVTDDGSPTIIGGDFDNSQFYFIGVRAVDGLGLEDENDVQLVQIPNIPPEWVSTVGIIDAEPMLGKAKITFGEATDDDGVSYIIYYSKISPIDFDYADKIPGVMESPYLVTGLDLGETYHFAVRAIDDLGLEDDNIVEASAEIWDTPRSKWLYPSISVIVSSPNRLDVNGDTRQDIIIGGRDNTMKALDAIDGTVAWPYPAPDAIDSSPCLVDINGGVLDVVFGCNDGNLYAVDGSNGDLLWTFPTDGPITATPASGDVDNDGDQDVVIGSADYSVYVVDVATHTEVWHKAGARAMNSAPALYDVTGDGKLEVFIGCEDGRMYCFNGDGVTAGWSYMTTSNAKVSSPAIGDVEPGGNKEVVFLSSNGYLYVLDATTAAFKWSYSTGVATTLGSPCLGDVNEDGAADIAFGLNDQRIILVNGATHTDMWTSPMVGGAVHSSPSMVDLTGEGILDILIGCDDGNLYCIDGSDGSVAFASNVLAAVQVGPLVFDIDNDGLLEIIFATTSGTVWAFDTDSPVPSPPDIIWPKYRRDVYNHAVL